MAGIDFMAIDFETANEKRNSACAFALVKVQGGEVVETKSWLVCPDDLEFSKRNISIHGITPQDVYKKPKFCELWSDIEPYFNGSFVVAHNAGFDISVLGSNLDLYNIAYPSFYYFCTWRNIAKRVWHLPSYRLDIVTKEFDFNLRHHDVSSDALACTQIVLEACKKVEATSFDDLFQKLDFEPAKFFAGYESRMHKKGMGKPRGAYPKGTKFEDIMPTTDEFDVNHPFYGKKLVFTGTLKTMARMDAWLLIKNLRGFCSNSVLSDTNFLVMGDQDFSRFADGKKSTKTKRVEELIKQGYDVEIISEEDFLRMVE